MVSNYIFELLHDDPTNIRLLNETLWEAKALSYSNLYRAQQSLTGIERVDIDLSEYTTEPNRYVYHTNVDFISKKHRLIYRKSQYYKKELSNETIARNPDIFGRTALIFINGDLYTNIRIRPREDITSFVFNIYPTFYNTPPGSVRDGFTKTEMEALISSGGKMTVFFVPTPHSKYSNSLNVPTVLNYATGSLKLAVDGVFEGYNDIKPANTFLAYMSYDDIRLYKYRLLDVFIDNNTILFNKEQIGTFTNTRACLKAYYLSNFMSRIELSGDNYFSLNIQNMPVPVENMMVFRKSGDNLYFDHTAKIVAYYPNIYEVIKDHADDVVIYTYYYDDLTEVGSKYSNELHLYYKFTQNVLEKYRELTIPEIIKKYNPIKVDYDFGDYKKGEISETPLLYKIDKLRS